MTPLPASLCYGIVGHTRHRPKAHSLRYSMLSTLIDIDDSSTPRFGRLWNIDSWALVSVFRDDYGRGDGQLRGWVEERLATAGVSAGIRRIELLTAPRVLGLKFNPLSVFFAFDDDDSLVGLVFEVSNFHGGRQAYAFAVDTDAGPDYHFTCPKDFFVSPFNSPDEGQYSFRLRRDETSFKLAIHLHVSGELVLSASHVGHLEPMTRQSVRTALARHPFNTLRIVGGILLEAARLALKGLRLHAPRRDTVDTLSRRS